MANNQNFWGPKLWFLIHTISYCSPESLSEIEQRDYYLFFSYIIPKCVPCPECIIHYIKLTNKYKFHGKTRDDLINYTILLHNKVNKRLKKQILERQEIDLLYNNKYKYINEIYVYHTDTAS